MYKPLCSEAFSIHMPQKSALLLDPAVLAEKIHPSSSSASDALHFSFFFFFNIQIKTLDCVAFIRFIMTSLTSNEVVFADFCQTSVLTQHLPKYVQDNCFFYYMNINVRQQSC